MHSSQHAHAHEGSPSEASNDHQTIHQNNIDEPRLLSRLALRMSKLNFHLALNIVLTNLDGRHGNVL